jgi:hypothetical protein
MNPPEERPIDTQAIAGLSADAVAPALELLETLPEATQLELRAELCRREPSDAGYGFLGANRAERRAESLRDELCGRN